MVSTLASQLQALAVAGKSGAAPVRSSNRPSLLFPGSQANDVDLRSIFALSEGGLDLLVAMDGRFKAYKKTLFSLESSQIDRELQAKEYNEKLNKSIATFLRLLSGYVMLTPAHQTLEYLIRRHKIQVYNVEEVVLCVLPYHETSLFVRVVQLLHIKNTRWQFLEPVQRSGAPPPRQVLVQRCMNDMAVLDAVCESAMTVSGIAAKSKTTVSFTSVVLVETLAEVPKVSTDLLSRILPFILHSFEKGVAEEYRVGALMVIGAVANRTTLAPSLVETFFDYISKAFQKGSESEGVLVLQLHLMVMIQLVQTQEIVAFPEKAFKIVVKVREFVALLADLAKIFNAERFLTLFCQALVEHCLQHENYEEALLHTIECLPVGKQVVPSVSRILEISFAEEKMEGSQQGPMKSRDTVRKVLRALEKRFPAELDKGVSLHFQQSEEARKGDKKEDPSFLFLSEVFRGSLYAPLAESHMSLYRSLDHPQAKVREAAVKQLAKVASTVDGKEGAEVGAMLREAYFRLLSDNNHQVLRAVLSAQDLVKVVPVERLFQALISILSRCKEEWTSGQRSSRGDVKIISKMVIDLLASEFLADNPSYMQQVALAFFDQLLQRPLTWRLNKLILKGAGRIHFHLFSDLARIVEETPSQTDGQVTKSKETRKRWQTTINGKIIKSLADKLLDDPTGLLPFLLKSDLSGNSKLLVALTLLQCFRQCSEGIIPEVLNASIQWLRYEWVAEGFEKASPVPELQIINYAAWDDSNCTPPGFYDWLDVNSKSAYTELLLRGLHSVVAHMPHTNIGKLETVGGNDQWTELFVLFATLPRKIFEPHVELLLSRLSVPERFSFLSKFFVMEGSAVPATVQVHSLDMLGSQLLTITGAELSENDGTMHKHLQLVLPPLLVAMSSPVKSVRKSACNCLEYLWKAWDRPSPQQGKGDKKLERGRLIPSWFGKIICALVQVRASVISSGTYLEEFFREKFCPVIDIEAGTKRNEEDHQMAQTFLVKNAWELPVYGQLILFGVIQGMTHGMDLVCATHERFVQLIERRTRCHMQKSPGGASERLTQAEVQLLEVLLKMYTPKASSEFGACSVDLMSPFLESLVVEGGSIDDPAVLQPCLAALSCLTPDFYCTLDASRQDMFFRVLVSLSTVNRETLRSKVHAVLRKIQVDVSTVTRHVEYLVEGGLKVEGTQRKKKKTGAPSEEKIALHGRWPTRGKLLSSTTTILELLIWKSDIEERQVLVVPLFKLLKNVIGGVWPLQNSEEFLTESDSGKGETTQPAAMLNVQHLILMNLESIVGSLATSAVLNKNSIGEEELDVVVSAINRAADGTTRNHALALLTSLARFVPDAVLKHVIDILTLVGESTLTQEDSRSHRVVSQMLTAVVPVWLTVEKDPTALLQVFVSALPRVPLHHRMTAVTNLLRVTTEQVSLHIFLFLLLEKSTKVSGQGKAPPEVRALHGGPQERTPEQPENLELEFARLLCRQYSPDVRLPALVKLLNLSKVEENPEIASSPEKPSMESMWELQQLVNQFVAEHLRVAELNAGVELPESSDTLQKSYVLLLEQALLQLQTLGASDSKLKKGSIEAAVSLLDSLTFVMASSEYIKGISSLMKHSSASIRRKVLRMYTLKMKELDQSMQMKLSKQKHVDTVTFGDEHFDAEELELYTQMIKDISGLLEDQEEEVSVSIKHAAIEALHVSAQRFASKLPGIFVDSLGALLKTFQAQERYLSAAAVQCVATIIAKLGPLALPALPESVSALLGIAEQALPIVSEADLSPPSELVMAILEALEAMVDKLGAFLTPYLKKIVSLVLLPPGVFLASDLNTNTKAAAVRTLLALRIPVRLLLEPLLSTYESAINTGEDSTCALFEMLASMMTKADRNSVAAYQGRVFEFCLVALDLRRRDLHAFQSISRVETAVINAMISLVMKLSETAFKPLFVKVLEWAASETETKDGTMVSQNVDRNIVFFKLVSELAGKLRSVFVPYLQYLINGFVHHLTGGVSEAETLKPKKKKKKGIANEDGKMAFTSSKWHLRQLVLSSLHKFFLYDTISFLDAPKFQLLLGPVVAQLVVVPPSDVPIVKSEGEHTEVPSVEVMDDTLVSCLGQMALTAGTDLLWKPLNHEVLMCTRVENARTRLLALKVVKFLADRLKEEYLVLLPETIPFLAECLEDTELTVVAKTQELVKSLEDLSGEDLAQYF